MSIPNVQMYRRVSSQLESSYVMISPSNEWFKQCLDFFISENPNVMYQKRYYITLIIECLIAKTHFYFIV